MMNNQDSNELNHEINISLKNNQNEIFKKQNLKSLQ